MNAPQQTISFYIPVLPTDMVLNNKPLFDEDSMKEFFETKKKIGKVSRIDYISKMGKNNNKIVSAFVHFEGMYDNNCIYFGKFLTDLKQGIIPEIQVGGYHDEQYYHRITSTANTRINRYFSIRLNKRPIQEVKVPDLNIHQLIDSNKFMENLIEEQKLKIAQMEAEMNELKNKLNALTDNTPATNVMCEMTLGELL
jgi:hypothetical protein